MSVRLAEYRHGIRAGLGFGAAAGVVGLSFGVVAQPVMGSVAPIVMSVFVFAGSAQFGATAVLASGGSAATAIATGVMLNARFLAMGIAAAPALRGGPLRRALEGQAVVDASWALAARGARGFDREALLGATLPQYPAWVLGTVVGVLLGGTIGDPADFGLDAIFPAFFLALLAAELDRPLVIPVVVMAGAIALAFTPILPAGLPVLLASTTALLGLRRR
ncbi:MAG TPA: AzlC family ABC transporter permease [Thermoleophilaceae bacterium]|nr:AzlC family ABC transporter permease [Thermoleophilaceae bacterium]